MVPEEHILGLAVALFAIGAWGALARRNLIALLLSLQLMQAAAALAFVGFNRYWSRGPDGGSALDGQVFALLIAAVAVAQLVVGLGILVSVVRNRDSMNIDDASALKW